MERFADAENECIASVLATHHEATKNKNVALLRSAFTVDGLFVGTDDTEQWTIGQLSRFLEDSEDGWDMTNCTDRSVYKIARFFDDFAAFFEVLVHKKYGPMRGSGVVIKGNDGRWRIGHYVLSFSVPNHVVDNTNILELLAS